MRRAIERGNLVVAEIEAREIGQLDLGEALELAAPDPRLIRCHRGELRVGVVTELAKPDFELLRRDWLAHGFERL